MARNRGKKSWQEIRGVSAGDADPRHQPAIGIGGQRDVELPLDRCRHRLACPQREREFELQRVLPRPVPSIHCIARAITSAAGRTWFGLQPAPTAAPAARQPASHCSHGDPQGSRGSRGTFARLHGGPFDELRSAHAQSLQRLVIEFARIVICDALKESHGLRAVNKNTKILMDGLIYNILARRPCRDPCRHACASGDREQSTLAAVYNLRRGSLPDKKRFLTLEPRHCSPHRLEYAQARRVNIILKRKRLKASVNPDFRAQLLAC